MDAEYIAASNPATVLQLIERCEKMSQALVQSNRSLVWSTKGPYGPSPIPDEELLELQGKYLSLYGAQVPLK